MYGLEKLEAWRLGKDVAIRTYRLTQCGPLRQHFKLADQIARAAVSIPANIAEGHALGTRAQFVKGLRIAFGSCQELRTHFEVGLGVSAIMDTEATRALLADIRRLNGLLVGLLKRYGASPDR